MKYSSTLYSQQRVQAKWSQFSEGEGSEYQVFLSVIDKSLTFSAQLAALKEAVDLFWHQHFDSDVVLAFRRFFLSDAANQQDELLASIGESDICVTSIVQQPPLDGSKVSLWIYALKGFSQEKCENDIRLKHNEISHFFTAFSFVEEKDSFEQTSCILNNYERFLSNQNMSIAQNCVRTWFFVRDVDVNYGGVVVARRENFENQGLTKDTHYIASTGIEGRHAASGVKVLFDAYAVKGLKENQISYLYAKSHLNPTYEYGVTFERGTCVEYADRKQLFVSGTASINNRGEVMHEGDIRLQTLRMLENVSALLAEREATFSDVSQAIVYLRDTADFDVVSQILAERLGDIPYLIVLAPVCRPKWLIEMECMATVPNKNDSLPAF